jgi:protein-S-isoprenylcysteine O-methyltransferase Ste14
MSDETPSRAGWSRALRVVALNVALSAGAILVAWLAFRVDARVDIELPTWIEPLCWPLIIPGALLVAWAALTLFRDGGATGAPGDPTLRLVTRGPYRLTRNPIYAGVVLMLLGVALQTRSPSFLLLTLIFIPILHLYVVHREEPALTRRFGPPYREYMRTVHRWNPGSRSGWKGP